MKAMTNDDNDQKVRTPLDPTNDARTFMGDISGLTGVSVDEDGSVMPTDYSKPLSRTMSKAAYDSAIATAEGKDNDDEVSTPGSQNLPEELQKDDYGEQSVSGDMPDPESDDDTLENSHKMGLRLDEDEEHPKELDIASDIDKAEEFHRTH
jgi:hypothetical protein